MSDESILLIPQESPITTQILFVCTYVAKLSNIDKGVAALTEQMCKSLNSEVVAINSNYGHACWPGYEHLLKSPKIPLDRHTPSRGRVRKVQGDGTCFNSAVEPILVIKHPGISVDKIYKVKCFPTTGETQVPGVICSDLSDGNAVLKVFVNYLNGLHVGTDPNLQITILSEQAKMLNYKFAVNRINPRILINLPALAKYMQSLENMKAIKGCILTDDQKKVFEKWSKLILPPYTVRETKFSADDVKVSFIFDSISRGPRINIFQKGKINILGADSVESAKYIYEFFLEMFTANWNMLVCIQPLRDSEKSQSIKPVQLSDADIDDILSEIIVIPSTKYDSQ